MKGTGTSNVCLHNALRALRRIFPKSDGETAEEAELYRSVRQSMIDSGLQYLKFSREKHVRDFELSDEHLTAKVMSEYKEWKVLHKQTKLDILRQNLLEMWTGKGLTEEEAIIKGKLDDPCLDGSSEIATSDSGSEVSNTDTGNRTPPKAAVVSCPDSDSDFEKPRSRDRGGVDSSSGSMRHRRLRVRLANRPSKGNNTPSVKRVIPHRACKDAVIVGETSESRDGGNSVQPADVTQANTEAAVVITHIDCRQDEINDAPNVFSVDVSGFNLPEAVPLSQVDIGEHSDSRFDAMLDDIVTRCGPEFLGSQTRNCGDFKRLRGTLAACWKVNRRRKRRQLEEQAKSLAAQGVKGDVDGLPDRPKAMKARVKRSYMDWKLSAKDEILARLRQNLKETLMKEYNLPEADAIIEGGLNDLVLDTSDEEQ
ncbi:hypothetical protein R1sor_019174 [Riccia sorocarpa]|uniref:Uncharacterized protein n=1 Tax=Riccia sorocarpa TaxID=122646 RepID=A0ABD3IEH8_9MARC